MLPARFTILPGERLSPKTIFSPPHIRVELIVVSKDGRAHRAMLHIPHPRSITVPRNGRVEQLLPLLAVGTYRLDIDGKPRGALHIGGAPGP
jgi:hypothetical protein